MMPLPLIFIQPIVAKVPINIVLVHLRNCHIEIIKISIFALKICLGFRGPTHKAQFVNSREYFFYRTCRMGIIRGKAIECRTSTLFSWNHIVA